MDNSQEILNILKDIKNEQQKQTKIIDQKLDRIILGLIIICLLIVSLILVIKQ